MYAGDSSAINAHSAAAVAIGSPMHRLGENLDYTEVPAAVRIRGAVRYALRLDDPLLRTHYLSVTFVERDVRFAVVLWTRGRAKLSPSIIRPGGC